MTTWIIEPRDPLIARDGRPFGATPGARARSLGFPFPSTTTGAFRTRLGQDAAGVFVAQGDALANLRKVAVAGPLLVELDAAGSIIDWLLPAPADALPTELQPAQEGRLRRVPLAPLALPPGCLSDLLSEGLAPVGPSGIDLRKPYAGAPRFWSHKAAFEPWLIAAQADPADGIPADSLGLRRLEENWRTHVSIDPARQAAAEGLLFQTAGLEFTAVRKAEEDEAARAFRRLALAVASEGQIAAGLGAVGGESRLAAWRASADPFPRCPQGVVDAVLAARACRVILLTPACFAEGYRPATDWLSERVPGVRPELVAAAVGRPAVVSGWDYAAQPKRVPKPTRRLAPAGSVYFLRLAGDGPDGKPTEDAVRAWLDAVWMRCVSEAEQDRLDGFGLAAVGAWSGELMKVEARA